MSDDDIVERGGTQKDIDAYAHDVGGACGAAYGGSCDYCGKVTPTEQDNESNQMNADTSEKIRDVISFVHSRTLSIGVYSPGDISVTNMYEEAASDFAEIIQQEIVKARIYEIGLMQHQARVNLKTSNAVAEWGDIRIAELKAQQELESYE